MEGVFSKKEIEEIDNRLKNNGRPAMMASVISSFEKPITKAYRQHCIDTAKVTMRELPEYRFWLCARNTLHLAAQYKILKEENKRLKEQIK